MLPYLLALINGHHWTNIGMNTWAYDLTDDT
jgi:hypothetical protein